MLVSHQHIFFKKCVISNGNQTQNCTEYYAVRQMGFVLWLFKEDLSVAGGTEPEYFLFAGRPISHQKRGCMCGLSDCSLLSKTEMHQALYVSCGDKTLLLFRNHGLSTSSTVLHEDVFQKRLIETLLHYLTFNLWTSQNSCSACVTWCSFLGVCYGSSV